MINKKLRETFVVFLMLGLISTSYAIGTEVDAPKIENVSIDDITETSASITFDVNQSNADTIIRYGTTATSLNKKSSWNNNSGQTRTIMLSGLSNNTKYYFSIYAYNNGKFSKSSTQNFTTTETIDPISTVPTIDNIGVNNVSNNSAKITFDVNQSNAKTIIRYGTTATSLNKKSSWNNNTAITRIITLSGLSKGKTYYFSIYAHNNTDDSKHSNSEIRNFTTTGDINVTGATVPTIDNIGIVNITNNSAKITFGVNQSDADTVVRYGSDEFLNKNSGWNNNTAITRIITLSDLSQNTTYQFSIYAHNGTNNSKYSNSTIRNFTTLPSVNDDDIEKPVITSKSPSEKTVHTVVGENATFNISFNQIVNVTWFLNATEVKNNTLVTFSSYLNDTGSIGNWNVTVKWSNVNGSDSYSWTWIVHPKTYRSGNRIWDSSKNMDTTYTWNSYSFAGFYYDLDKDQGTEELTIKNIDRNLNNGDITYKTSPIDVYFDYSNFGRYQVIGFMADKYFAGYTSNSSFSEEKSTLASRQLHKVLLDDEDKRTVSVGGTLTLKEDYVLQMKEIDVGAGTGQIWVRLLKGGNEIDDDVVAGGETYVYKKKVGSVDDLTVIAIHFDSVFRGREVNAAFIKGVFQISDSYTKIDNGNKYGKMEISSVDKNQITMKNDDDISLSKGDTVDLMGNLKIVVADSDALRFGLSIESTGKFEARGTIYPVVDEWTPFNFGLDIGGKNVGFYYNIDDDIGTEKLKVKTNGRSIKEGNLVYSTVPQDVSFDYSNFGKYKVVGFMAEKYFAGYTSNSSISDNDEINTIGNGQLHKILLDDDVQRVISVGGTITLKEGYVLKAKEIDVGAGPGQMWIVLLKDGSEVDNDVIAKGDTYIYKKKVGSTNDLPIIAVHIDSIFRGTEVNAAFFKGMFQISDSYTEVKSGKTYGKMEVSGTGNEITMKNNGDISLSEGNTIDIMGDIKFKVADSGTLRFYPFVLVTEEMQEEAANKLKIDAPNKTTAGDTITIKIRAGSEVIFGVLVSIDQMFSDKKTDEKGELNVTIPTTLKGNYTIKAAKLGYQNANRTIEIEEYIESKLNINLSTTVADQFDTISIQVTSNNVPINGVEVKYDNDTIGLTDAEGKISYKLQTSGDHTISAFKQKYISVTREIHVREPFSEFKALDINITPNKIIEGNSVFIVSNITNSGTKSDTKSVELIFNDTVVDNKNITIDPKEIKQINFTYRTRQEGNYTLEILEQKGSLEVQNKPFNIFLVLAIITIIGAIIIYMSTSKDSMNNIKDLLSKIKR